jgi:hypothetical protein
MKKIIQLSFIISLISITANSYGTKTYDIPFNINYRDVNNHHIKNRQNRISLTGGDLLFYTKNFAEELKQAPDSTALGSLISSFTIDVETKINEINNLKQELEELENRRNEMILKDIPDEPISEKEFYQKMFGMTKKEYNEALDKRLEELSEQEEEILSKHNLPAIVR